MLLLIHLYYVYLVILLSSDEYGPFISNSAKYELNRSSSVGNSLGKTSLTPLVGYYLVNDGLWVNSSPVKEEFIIFPFFLIEENARLPMTARADCDVTPDT